MEAEPLENVVHFYQGCPVCGRTLRIQIVLLGSSVYCQHCGGGFVAADASLRADDGPVRGDVAVQEQPNEPGRAESLLQRAEWLLERVRS